MLSQLNKNFAFIYCLKSRTIGEKYRHRETVARRSKGPNPDIGRPEVKSTIWSHDGEKNQCVIFVRGAPKIGKKSWRETFGTIGVKIRSLSRLKFRKFDLWSHLKRPEPRFRSHAGQKDRFVIFGCGAPKTGKKSWGETLCTTGVKFRSESEVALCNQSAGMALCRMPPQHIPPDGSK